MDQTGFQPTQSPKSWYKTNSGIFFIITISIVVGLLLLFVGNMIYYIIQIKLGKKIDFTTKNNQQTTYYIQNFNDNINNYLNFRNPSFGNKNSKVKILIFEDFECPYSLQAFPELEKIRQKYEPVVEFQYKYFPINEIRPHANKTSLAAKCAQEQNKFWEYYRIIFENQKFEDSSLVSAAEMASLNIEKFNLCLEEQKYQEDINSDLAEGLKLKIRGTPTFFINDSRIEGVVDVQTWDKLIMQNLEKYENN